MIFALSDDIAFPDPLLAEENGLLAIGGNLDADRLILAYANGIFPWFHPNDEILWWSSPYRPIYTPGKINLSKSLKRTIRKFNFEIRIDKNFDELIRNCATANRKGENETWISEEIISSYQVLFNLGFVHTVEVFLDNKMVGGLYGAAFGKGFFGESMFQSKSDASKVALFALSEMLKVKDYLFIDSQVSNPHSYRMGAHEISKINFLQLLQKALDYETEIGPWNFDFSQIMKL